MGVYNSPVEEHVYTTILLCTTSSFSEDAKLTESMANDAETVVDLIITNADSDVTAEADATEPERC